MSKSSSWDKIPKELLKKQADYIAYLTFGTFLLQKLKVNKNISKRAWFELVEEFHRINSGKRPGLMYINWIICQEFKQIPVKVRYNKNKKSKLVLPKQVSMYLASTLFNYIGQDICDFYEAKDLSSIAGAKKTIADRLSVDKKFKEQIDSIIRRLLGYKTQ